MAGRGLRGHKSVNGLIDFFKSQNLVGEYNWIFTFKELQRTLALYGPVIVGCEWREGCFEPDRAGLHHLHWRVQRRARYVLARYQF